MHSYLIIFYLETGEVLCISCSHQFTAVWIWVNFLMFDSSKNQPFPAVEIHHWPPCCCMWSNADATFCWLETAIPSHPRSAQKTHNERVITVQLYVGPTDYGFVNSHRTANHRPWWIHIGNVPLCGPFLRCKQCLRGMRDSLTHLRGEVGREHALLLCIPVDMADPSSHATNYSWSG